jgi:hypothetical protein
LADARIHYQHDDCVKAPDAGVVAAIGASDDPIDVWSTLRSCYVGALP